MWVTGSARCSHWAVLSDRSRATVCRSAMAGVRHRRGSEVVIVSIHRGANGIERNLAAFCEFAQRLDRAAGLRTRAVRTALSRLNRLRGAAN